MHRLHRDDHRFDALLHRCKPARRRERNVGGAGGPEACSCLFRSVGEFFERGALCLVRLDCILECLDRQPGDHAAVVAAHLREVGPAVRRRIGIGVEVATAPAGIARQVARIAHQVVIAIKAEDAGVEVRVAIAPERIIIGIAPEGVVINVIESERPEQGADPPKTAIAMAPPPPVATMPRRRGHACGDERAGARIAQRDGVVQRPIDRARVQ